MNSTRSSVQDLHEIKGVLTKFMRMLFPLEFRVDSLADCGALLPVHYPLTAGEMIYLPEKADNLDSQDLAYDYYFVTAAHLAGRHEFGTFDFRLSEVSGFEDRAETGLEGLESFTASFEDPTLAGALLRLCEAARVEAYLSRRYLGLVARSRRVNYALAAALDPMRLSTVLVNAAFGLDSDAAAGQRAFTSRAARFFAPLRKPGATVLQSTRQTAALYRWLSELRASAERIGADDTLARDAAQMRDDLATMRGMRGEAGAQSDDEGASNSQDGNEPNQRVQLEVSGKSSKGEGGRALSPEEIQRLLEQGAQIKPSEATGEGAEGEGMYLTQLLGKQANELEQLREQLAEIGAVAGPRRLIIGARGRQDAYYAYDEWDYILGDYRRNWCRLREVRLSGDEGDFYNRTLERYSEMLPQVRRHFQRIRPASYRMVRGLEDGEEIDLDRTIETRVARLMGQNPDSRVYKARKKEARDVATLFLLDMSASTDEPIHRDIRRHTDDDDADDWMKAWQRRPQAVQRPRRVIDVNKEALVIMAQALEELGDQYAVMGFSGHGRDNVEFYVIKEFNQELSDEVKARVGAVEPKRSTRMGAAIRHVREKFKDVASRAKHMILLSDGFPQDFDYGHDRRSNAYGIQDTMVALKELELAGVLPFCITVDRTGHDYLRQMCQPSRYLVIEDITSLPRQLPKIYEQVVRW
ncbi:MAG: VWA domain-containing protein [Candidatus Binataceae bacterium]